jgi:membrane carboxypeptidase/penicillin-binding protein
VVVLDWLMPGLDGIGVLERMREEKFITPSEEKDALASPIQVNRTAESSFDKAPYFTEFIRHQVERKYGKEKLYQEGLRIYTTLDLSLQRIAQKSVEMGLRELDKRQGFRGPLHTLPEKEVKELLTDLNTRVHHEVFSEKAAVDIGTVEEFTVLLINDSIDFYDI